MRGRHRSSSMNSSNAVHSDSVIEGPLGATTQPAGIEGSVDWGFGKQNVAVCVIAYAIVVMVRPTALNFFRLLPFLLPLLVVSFYFTARSSAAFKSVLIPLPVLVTVAWFIATTAWSGTFVLSVAESIVIICVAGTASLVGSFCTLRDLVFGVLTGCAAIYAASVVVAVASPAYGLVSDNYEAGSLKGVMLDRNSLAFVLILGLTATLSYNFSGSLPLLKKVLVGALMFAGVLWTSSSTGLILAVVAILMATALAVLRTVPPSRRGWALAAGASAISVGVSYVVANFDELLKLVERDSTYTGRTLIWPAVEQVISRSPWLGQGWGGVWGFDRLHQQINRSVGFAVPHSHNGYLDVEVQVGLVGLIFLLVVVFMVALCGIRYYLRSNSCLSSWAPILVVVLLVYNRVETSFSAPPTLFLLFVTLVILERDKRVQQV